MTIWITLDDVLGDVFDDAGWYFLGHRVLDDVLDDISFYVDALGRRCCHRKPSFL